MSSTQEDLSTEAYAAQLAGEVEKLKVGDRTQNDDEEEFDATFDTSAAASASSASSAAAAASSSSASLPNDPSIPASIEEVVEKDSVKSLAAKVRGNEFFARQNYPAAIDEYNLAVDLCPTGEEATPEHREQLSVYYSNRAACHLMQGAYEQTIADCTASLDLHPGNPKPLGRRAKAYEKLDQLPEAIEDLKALVALDPLDRDSALALARVEQLQAEKTEKMKTEMMGKLKDFGNTLLGKFGMSLDNFKATQDPSTGSYNISFGK
jgi:tetratricopeptide (TPR) repeat protein